MMASFVCIAGLTREIIVEIERQPARFSGHKYNKPIMHPIIGDLRFRDGMSDAYTHDLVENIIKLPDREDVTIVIAYANLSGSGTSRFLDAFFPYAVTMPFEPFFYNAFPRCERRRRLKEFLDKLAGDIATLRKCSLQIKDKLSGQRFSPLTLPIRNFHSEMLHCTIEGLFRHLWQSASPAESIKAACQSIEASHPKMRIKHEECGHPSDIGKPYFLDNRGLRFKSPGGDLHGLMAEVRDGHNHKCLLSSRVRIGGPILARMHYDCDYYPKRRVDDTFTNCHGESAFAKKDTHANIAPSDAVW